VIPESVAGASALAVAGLITWGFARWVYALPQRMLHKGSV